MKPTGWIRGLFLLAALYDGVLGVWFLVAPGHPFELFEVAPPNHMAYVQFPAALLLIFGLMFLSIAWNPVAHRTRGGRIELRPVVQQLTDARQTAFDVVHRHGTDGDAEPTTVFFEAERLERDDRHSGTVEK